MCRQTRALLLSAESRPANTTPRTASAVGAGLAVVWVAPPWPHSQRFHSARIHEGVAVRFARSQIRANHQRIGLALLYEADERLADKLLLIGFCLAGLTCARASAGD